MPDGFFITLEGGEGVGKSTQLRRLADRLRADGRDVVATREPGGTPGAEAMRALLLDPSTVLDPLADTLLHFAARADHAGRVIRPALARGAIVLCDRFYDSTLAYQGFGLGVARAPIDTLIRLIGLHPDLTIVLDAPDDVAKTRLAARGGSADRYERIPGLMGRVAEGFRAIAAADPGRCVLVDATPDADAVAGAVWSVTTARLPR